MRRFDIAGASRSARRAIGRLRGDGTGWVVLTVAVGWMAILGLRFAVPAVLPAIKREFAIDNAAAGLAVTVVWVTYAGMQLPAGVLADRIGERRLLVASLVVAGGSLLAFVVVPTYPAFLAASAAFGLGTGLYGPPRGTVISKTYAENDGAAFGAVLAAGSLGAALFPLFASLVTVRVGWRAALGVAAPAFFVVAAGTWVAVPAFSNGRPGTDGDGGSVDRSIPTVAAVVSRRSVVVASIGATLMLFAFQGLTAFFSTYLVETKGLSQATAGGLFALLFVSGAVVQSVGGRAADRFGHRRVLLATAVASVPPLLALPYVDGVVPLSVVAVLLGVRLAVAPVSNAYIVGVLPDETQGTVWGLLRTGLFVLGSFGSTVIGAMADRELFGEAFLLLAGLVAVAAVVFAFLPPRRDAAPD